VGQYDQLAQAMANDMSAWFLRFDAANVGTWTPAFTGTTIAGTFTYAHNTGRWTRLGNRVAVSFAVGISAIAVAPTGTMRITGLPFTAFNTGDGYHGATFGYISNLNAAAGTFQVTGLIDFNSTYIRIIENAKNAGSADFPAANFNNANCFLIGSAVYEI